MNWCNFLHQFISRKTTTFATDFLPILFFPSVGGGGVGLNIIQQYFMRSPSPINSLIAREYMNNPFFRQVIALLQRAHILSESGVDKIEILVCLQREYDNHPGKCLNYYCELVAMRYYHRFHIREDQIRRIYLSSTH